MTSTSQPTAASSDDQPLILNLDDTDKAVYEKFIESLTEKFEKDDVDKYLRNFDDEGVNADIIFRKFKSEIENCFPEIPASSEGEDTAKRRVRRTYKPSELHGKNWVLQVRLKHGNRNLDILIKKNNLYLVGYKGKYKEKDGTVLNAEAEQAEYWIVLKENSYHNEVANSVENILQSKSVIKEVELRTSYTALFAKSDPSSKNDVPESGLLEKLKNKLKSFQERAEREEDRNIEYAKNLLQKIKRENPKGKDADQIKNRVDKLLGKVERRITREDVKANESDYSREELEFLNHLKKPQGDHIPAGKLIEKLGNKAETSENERNDLFQNSPLLWGELFRKGVVILGSFTDKKMNTTYWERKISNSKDQGKELDAVIEMIRMLEKENGNVDALKTKPATQCPEEEILKHFFSKKDTLKDLYDNVVNKDDQAKFCKELREMSKVLKLIMQSVKEDAEITRVKKCMAKVKLNRLAFTEAVDHLTQYPFHEDDDKIAMHIIKLAVMICEAARFPNITEHVARNYHTESHEDTLSLSSKCITSLYNWSNRSAFVLRGGVFRGEGPLTEEELGVINHMDGKEIEQ
ncbi:hypothetical protein ACET3Z_030561 [Daucus carota]